MAGAHEAPRRIGEVIRQARVLQRRSQKDVAAALGYHQSKVSRLESGRGTDDMRVLRAIAQELEIAPHKVGLAPAPPSRTATAEPEGVQRRTFLTAGIAALGVTSSPAAARDALVQALLPGSALAVAPVPPTSSNLASLQNRVGAARRLFHTCDYAMLERNLPELIADLRWASDNGRADDPTLSCLLATAYQTATSLLLKQHDQGGAWLAVGRAMAEAERSGDPVVLASSVRVQAHVLAREKHTPQAVTLVRHTTGQLSGSYDRRSPKYLAAVGLLLLRGVTASSSGGDRAAAAEFLTEAKEVARYVTLDQPDAWANFCQTNVALHEISALVALGDAGRALQVAGPLTNRPIPVPERRSALWVEIARAQSQLGHLADGYQALRMAETCAAQDVHRPAIRNLAADMAARDHRRTLPELHRFSHRLGVPA
ncbi:helix-turn-helix domain-containing protein [Streptomyces paradoxus]|uniref:helix-turn-helix domain-containing protein n=1 Tax=Streptomyces paradoxus TaxID=66375 RepID=UPI00362506CB